MSSSTHPARASLRTALVLPLVTFAAAWAALWSWRGFTTDPHGYLLPLLVIGLASTLVASVLRWRRVPAGLVVLAQVVTALVAASVHLTGSPVPGRALGHALTQAVHSANTYAPPVPDRAGLTVQPLLVLSGLGLLILVDLVACTWRRVSLAGLVLLAVYSVPVSLLGHGLPWWVFAATAALFLLMLYVQEQAEVDRWGRSLTARTGGATRSVRSRGRTPGRTARTAGLRGRAAVTAAVAVGVASLLPTALPSHRLDLTGFGPGAGGGSSIRIDNPMVDVRRDLMQGPDTPLLRVVTTDPDPGYLRISVLDRFSGSEWSSGDRQVPSDQIASGSLPALQGVDPAIPRTSYHYQVSADSDFSSTWLPTEAPISAIEADGDWRYDTSTMDFIAASHDLTTQDLSYSMTAVQLHLTAARLDLDSRTRVTGIAAELTSLPADLPPIVSTLASDVTARDTTPFQKAVALQSFFRDPANGFRYSLDNSLGDSSGDLGTFLDPEKGRTGYCQQYAAAMAAMARSLGIPARVAVGFLSPTLITDDTYEYSAHDLHAWPELYFSGAGWVRFDPTPSQRVPEAPAYTAGAVSPAVTGGRHPRAQKTSGQDPPINPKASQLHPAQPSRDRAAARGATTTGDQGSGFAWTPVISVLALLLVGVAVVVVPGSVRRRRRRRRLDGSVEEVWDEVRDTTLDLGAPWPADRSPREAHARVAGLFGARDDIAFRPARGPDRDPAATAALARITTEIEQSRYAAGHGAAAPGHLREDALQCIAALEAGAGPRARRRARWWPVSLLPRLAARLAARSSAEAAAGTGTSGSAVAVERV